MEKWPILLYEGESSWPEKFQDQKFIEFKQGSVSIENGRKAITQQEQEWLKYAW